MNWNSFLDSFKFSATRNTDGSIWYDVGKQCATFDGHTSFSVAMNNPVIFGLIDRIGSLASQVEFYQGDNPENNETDLIELMEMPNAFQSKQDFIKELTWHRFSRGFVYTMPIHPEGFKDVKSLDSLYNLSSQHIKYNKEFQTKLLLRSEFEDVKNKQFNYSIDGKDRTFNVGEVIAMYDVANGLCDDFLLTSPSRIDACIKPAVNLIKALEAQNVIINSNGRELFSSAQKSGKTGEMAFAGGLPMDSEDKKAIDRVTKGYGLTAGKTRAIHTNQQVAWQSLHIPLKDLGLKETIDLCASLVATTFNVPKEVIPLFGDSKYENKKWAEVFLIQTPIKQLMDDFVTSFNNRYDLKGEERLNYSFDHLEAMQMIEDMKANKAFKISQALKNLKDYGMDNTESLEFLESLGIKI
mgnify:FL=1